MDAVRVALLREVLAGTEWLGATRRFAGALRGSVVSHGGGLLLVGTPEYASPEQAEVMTGAVDETSDVYSLGVLLYELLIGTVPFDPARLRHAGDRRLPPALDQPRR